MGEELPAACMGCAREVCQKACTGDEAPVCGRETEKHLQPTAPLLVRAVLLQLNQPW